MQRSNWLWSLISWALSITVIALLLYNFFSEEPQVEKLAIETACAGKPSGCTPVMRRGERTPFGRSWDYDVDPKTYVHVVCRREYIVLGDYACTSSP